MPHEPDADATAVALAAWFHDAGPGAHGDVPPGVGQVVVVAVERPGRQAQVGGEALELVEGLVADQVGEAPPVRRPDRPVDQDHTSMTATPGACATNAAMSDESDVTMASLRRAALATTMASTAS